MVEEILGFRLGEFMLMALKENTIHIGLEEKWKRIQNSLENKNNGGNASKRDLG